MKMMITMRTVYPPKSFSRDSLVEVTVTRDGSRRTYTGEDEMAAMVRMLTAELGEGVTFKKLKPLIDMED